MTHYLVLGKKDHGSKEEKIAVERAANIEAAIGRHNTSRWAVVRAYALMEDEDGYPIVEGEVEYSDEDE